MVNKKNFILSVLTICTPFFGNSLFMTEHELSYDLTDERKVLIEEALRIRAKAREQIGTENLNKLYYMLTGKFPDNDSAL